MGRLTDLALDILLSPDARQRDLAIQRAALLPSIHAELWNQYKPHLPSDHALRYDLVRNRGFTETGAAEFINEFRETIAFARLAESTNIGSEEEDANGEAEPERGSVPQHREVQRTGMRWERPVGANVLTIPVPVSGAAPIVIEGEFPVTEAAWDQFIAVLTAMKPGLVSEPIARDLNEDQ